MLRDTPGVDGGRTDGFARDAVFFAPADFDAFAIVLFESSTPKAHIRTATPNHATGVVGRGGWALGVWQNYTLFTMLSMRRTSTTRSSGKHGLVTKESQPAFLAPSDDPASAWPVSATTGICLVR